METRSPDREALRERVALAKAHAARAEDARHGAGQISLSAQRAPTVLACDDGWARAAAIAAGAEASSFAAVAIADAIEREAPSSSSARAARAAARRAEAAASQARALIAARNDAYTFHADPGFSFGEGWHVAAAAVLAGVAIQVEPDKPATSQALRFLRDAGLGAQLQAYRPRPRAMKQTTELVARAFRADPRAAQRRLRAAFLGDAPIAGAVADWADRRLAGAPDAPKVVLWVRDGTHHRHRNTAPAELAGLARCARAAGLVPVFVGEAFAAHDVGEGAVDLTLLRREPVFSGEDGRRAQLQLFEHLRERHGVVGQIGVTTAGMDGAALMGLPTMFLTDAPNVRLRAWVSAVPGYEEIVRDAESMARVERALRAWALDYRGP